MKSPFHCSWLVTVITYKLEERYLNTYNVCNLTRYRMFYNNQHALFKIAVGKYQIDRLNQIKIRQSYYFKRLKIKEWVAALDLGLSKVFISIFVKFQWNRKVNWKDFWKEFCKRLWKKIILGISDAWSMRLSFRRLCIYYMEDCRISHHSIM